MSESDPDTDDGADDETPPVACTIDEGTFQQRRPWMVEEFLPLIADTEQLDDGIAVTLEGAGETVETVARFVNEESDCCGFASYEIATEPPYDETRLTITGPEGTAELFQEGLVDLLDEPPETLDDLPKAVARRHSPS